MLDVQFWLMCLGFFLIGFAVGDVLFSYLPKSIKRNKLSIFIIPLVLGGLVISIPLSGLLGTFFTKGIIDPSKVNENIKQLDKYEVYLKSMLANASELEKKIIIENLENIKNQKRQLLTLTTYNFNLFLGCGLCIFTGSLISIVLARRNENHE